MTPQQRSAPCRYQPHAGCLFAVDLPVSGPPALPYRGPLDITDAC